MLTHDNFSSHWLRNLKKIYITVSSARGSPLHNHNLSRMRLRFELTSEDIFCSVTLYFDWRSQWDYTNFVFAYKYDFICCLQTHLPKVDSKNNQTIMNLSVLFLLQAFLFCDPSGVWHSFAPKKESKQLVAFFVSAEHRGATGITSYIK